MIDEKVKSRLIEIPLSDNNIRSAGATALSDALKTNTSLTELCLDCGSRSQIQEYAFVFTFFTIQVNGIGKAGEAALCDLLKTNTSLTRLDVM